MKNLNRRQPFNQVLRSRKKTHPRLRSHENSTNISINIAVMFFIYSFAGILLLLLKGFRSGVVCLDQKSDTSFWSEEVITNIVVFWLNSTLRSSLPCPRQSCIWQWSITYHLNSYPSEMCAIRWELCVKMFRSWRDLVGINICIECWLDLWSRHHPLLVFHVCLCLFIYKKKCMEGRLFEKRFHLVSAMDG